MWLSEDRMSQPFTFPFHRGNNAPSVQRCRAVALRHNTKLGFVAPEKSSRQTISSRYRGKALLLFSGFPRQAPQIKP